MIRLTAILLLCIGGVMLATEPVATDRTTRADVSPSMMAPVAVRSLPATDEAAAVQIALEGMAAPRPRVEVSTPTPTPASAPPAPATGAAEETGYVTGSVVNLRGGPSTADAVVGTARLGDAAAVLERREDGWVRVRIGATSDRATWIFGQFLDERPPA